MEHHEGRRSDLFVALADRLKPDTYLAIRDHFDEHLADPNSGIEGAYLCLLGKIISLSDSLRQMNAEMFRVVAGDNLFNELPHKKEEPP